MRKKSKNDTKKNLIPSKRNAPSKLKDNKANSKLKDTKKSEDKANSKTPSTLPEKKKLKS